MTKEPTGIRNCHAVGVHSIALTVYPDGRPRVRMFVAEPNHRLGENSSGSIVGFHAHRADLVLTRLYGHVCNVTAYKIEEASEAVPRSRGCREIKTWRYTSPLIEQEGGFTRIGTAWMLIRKPVPFFRLELAAADLHTVYVPANERAAWLVTEGELSPGYSDTVYTDTDLEQFDFAGMYEPMSPGEPARWVQEAVIRQGDEIDALCHSSGQPCAWQPIATLPARTPESGAVLLASQHNVLGLYSGVRNLGTDRETWFIDDCLYDGDEPPAYWSKTPDWMTLPKLPVKQ